MYKENGIGYTKLYHLCQKISKKLDKPASQLTHDDIKLNFEDINTNLFGTLNISNIVNQYIKRKHLNEQHEWKAKEKGYQVKYYSDNEFIKYFGDKPWEIINQVLEKTFEGKFYFEIPNEEDLSYSYQAKLLEKNNNQIINENMLSSGEKTLFWLALTLFNSQYNDNSKKTDIPKLLLLDEPDAFLHPKMVVKMYQVLNSFIEKFDTIIMITTHSPTTVALAPENSTYLVDNNKVSSVDKDTAIVNLLDGVTQIAINPENRRQVFTESVYDAEIYQNIYQKLLQKSKKVDSKISLTFVSAGSKMPDQQIIDKLKQHFQIEDPEKVGGFIASINGVGSCSHVYGTVESFLDKHHNIRGIVDWDKKNKSKDNIIIFANNIAYAIENIVLDPICILTLLHLEKPSIYTMESICEKDIDWSDWIEDSVLLQKSIDKYMLKVLGRENKKDSDLKYISGATLKTDLEYLHFQGHDLANKILEKYPELKKYKRNGKDGELKNTIVKTMITTLTGKFIPEVFEVAMIELQK
jgi:energy-coupling factor transporter ATP-binding protein EcfA2